MSDKSSTPKADAPEADADKGEQENEGFTPPASQSELDKIIADRLSRERAKFADYKDLKAKATEYDKVVEASKTEAQKQSEALAAAEAKVKEYEEREQVAAWKAEVAASTGVPASVLAGSTKEAIEAHAETLKPLIEKSAALQPIPGEGRETPTPLNGDGIEGALRTALGIK